MTVQKKMQKTLCPDCQNLVGKPRYTKPHTSLVLTGGKASSSMTGPADESYYTCKICNHEWLYENGSNGMGWIV
jgi:RNase P subunit RPR2